ncbi:unnamed protein product [Sphagnum compactum]
MIIEVLSAPFRPDKVEDEAPEDVEWLAGISEAARVVRELARRIIFVFQDGFTDENEGPGDLKISVGFPFGPNTLISFPGGLSFRTVKAPGIDVASLGGVSEERRVPERLGGMPSPFPWVPGKVLNEAVFEDPEDRGLLVGIPQFSCYFEVGSGSVLSQNPDRKKVRGVGTFAVNGESGLVSLVSEELFPGFASRGKPPDEQFGQQSLRLGLGVDDSQPPLGGR